MPVKYSESPSSHRRDGYDGFNGFADKVNLRCEFLTTKISEGACSRKLGRWDNSMFMMGFLLPIGMLLAADPQAKFSADIQKSALQATVRIVGKDGKKGASSGSGVVIGVKDGFAYALSANHVLANARLVQVEAFLDGERTNILQSEVLATAPESDLALFRFPIGKSEIVSLTLAEKSTILKQFPVDVLNSGWQLYESPTLGEDRASARLLLRQPDGSSAFFWQTTGTSEPGRSGGPLISTKGELIGICSGNQDNRGYFAHRDEIHYFLRKHSSSSWIVSKK